jgi:hypothetical protein
MRFRNALRHEAPIGRFDGERDQASRAL